MKKTRYILDLGFCFAEKRFETLKEAQDEQVEYISGCPAHKQMSQESRNFWTGIGVASKIYRIVESRELINE